MSSKRREAYRYSKILGQEKQLLKKIIPLTTMKMTVKMNLIKRLLALPMVMVLHLSSLPSHKKSLRKQPRLGIFYQALALDF
jgi:hypothetical protein